MGGRTFPPMTARTKKGREAAAKQLWPSSWRRRRRRRRRRGGGERGRGGGGERGGEEREREGMIFFGSFLRVSL